jgi:hypothetical protein
MTEHSSSPAGGPKIGHYLKDSLRVGCVKDRFGKLCRQDIKRPDVLAFMRSYEAEGKLETRDRVRSIGEQICNYADVEGDAYIPQPVAALFRLRQTPHLNAP